MNRKSMGWAVARSTLWGLAFLFCLALAVTIYASGPDDGGSATTADAAQVNRLVGSRSETPIYLPYIVKMAAAATTSSATLTQPPARRQLGMLGGLLAAGLLAGFFLIYSDDPTGDQQG